MAVDAAGVHLGADDLPLEQARSIMGGGKIIGASAKTMDAARAAQTTGADYIGVGAIFPTATKVKTLLTPVAVLKDVCQAVDLPVAAIGGLNADNLDVLRGSGAAGVCVVSAIMRADDPGAAARLLRARAAAVLKARD
jgi:thiamine-phosphate pyrophosphorylase